MKARYALITLLASAFTLSSCDVGYTFLEGALGMEPGTISETERAFKDIKKDIKDIKKDFKDVKKEVKESTRSTSTNGTNTNSNGTRTNGRHN